VESKPCDAGPHGLYSAIPAGLKVTGANIAARVKQISHIEVDRVAGAHPYALGTGATASEIVHHPPGLTGKANGLRHSGMPTRLECGKARIGAKAIQAASVLAAEPQQSADETNSALANQT